MNRFFSAVAFGAALGLATAASAAPEAYKLDPGHSQILFSYNHLGFSTGHGMFSGFDGEIMFDQENPADSSVMVSFPVKTMITGWQARFDHFMSPDFFNVTDDQMVTFKSTGIEMTGDKTALISGDLTLNNVTKPVVLNAVLNQSGMHPMENKPWAGFSATATILRSDYNLGLFAPYVSDEVALDISVEASKVE